MKKILLFTFLNIFINSYAQNKITFIDKSNSKLPENDLWAICKNGDSTIWIGSARSGLIKYSSGNFEIFDQKNSIISNSIISLIFEDSKSNIWLTTSNPNRIIRYNGKKFEEIKNELLDNKSIIDIREDNSGNIYFAGAKMLVKYDRVKWENIELPSKDIIFRAIDINSNGEIALGHNGGLFIKKENKWISFTKENSELQLGTVRAVKYSNDGKLFIGYGGGLGGGGLSILDKNSWTHFNKSNSKIPDHTISDIEVDKNGVYWMATNNGLVKFKDNKIDSIFFREGIYKNTIMDVTIQNNTIWLATNFGIVRLD